MPARKITRFKATADVLRAWSANLPGRRFTDPAGTAYTRLSDFDAPRSIYVIMRRDVDGVWLAPVRFSLRGVEDPVAAIVRGEDA